MNYYISSTKGKNEEEKLSIIEQTINKPQPVEKLEAI